MLSACRAVVPTLTAFAIVLGATACARAGHVGPPASSAAAPAVHAEATVETSVPDAADAARPHAAGQAATVLDLQGRPAVARVGEREVLAAEDGQADAQGRFTRIRMVRRDGLKYPLIRQVEIMQSGPGGEAVRIALHEAVADHVQVTVHDPATRARIADALPAGCAVLRTLPGTPVVLVRIPAAAHGDHPAALAALAATPGVSHADPDWLVHAAITPGDPSFPEQWALDNQGQGGGTVDADIDAPEAWAYHTGSRSVRVGVIDTGIDLQHPDLIDNLWTNPGEVAANGIDDDGNGYVDDVHGWNFANDNANPDDDHFHGTHVAGTIGAGTGNGIGVAGVCWQVTMVPLKFLDANGGGYSSDAVAAVYYASSIGCDMTSNSWGGGGYDQTLKDAIDAAGAQGRLFIAAAGNDASDIGSYPSYPASYACANLVAVAASDRNDVLAGFSNYNGSAVHIAAPGVSILSTFPTQQTAAMAARGLSPGYGSISGTSMATPHVSGAVALLKAAQPGLDATALRNRLLQRSDAIAGLVGKVAGGRRLNLRLMLDPAWTPSPTAVVLAGTAMVEQQGDQDGFPGPGEQVRLTPSFMNLGEVDPGLCSVAALSASAGVTVLPPAAGTIAGLPPLASVGGPAFSVQLSGSLADGQTIAVDFAVSGPAGSLGTFRWSGLVSAPPPRAEATTTLSIGEMVADPVRSMVYVVDATMPSIMAINTQTGRLTARTPLSGAPNLDPPASTSMAGTGLPAVSTDGSLLYVCLPRARVIQSFALPGLQAVRTITCQGWEPFSAATGPDGALYATSHDGWGPIRKLDPVSGAVLASFGYGPSYPEDRFYMLALLRTNQDHTRLYVAETGLWTVGGPGYVRELDISASVPVYVKSHPYQQVFLSDYAIDHASGTLLTTNGGIYGVQVTSMGTGAYGTMWPFGTPYGSAVQMVPGDATVYGASAGPYDATIYRFNLATGAKTGSYPLSKGGSGSLPNRGFVIAPDRRMVYNLRGGSTGNKLGIIGCGSLTLDNYPRASGTVSPLSGTPGMTVTANGTASYDPDAGGGIVSYLWRFGDGATADTPTASHTYPVRGSYTVTLDVTDVEGLVDRKTFAVLVNGTPVAQAQSVTTQEDTAKAITLLASDPEGDAIAYSITSYPGKGSLGGTAPNLIYTPYANQNGSDSFTFRASDGLSNSTASVTIAITAVNDPPAVSDRSVLTRIDAPVAFSIAAIDPDTANLVYQITQLPASGSLSGVAPSLIYTPAPGFAGVDSMRFTASDGTSTSVAATVTLRVNRPPVANAASVAVAYETATPFVLGGSDPDGQALTYRVTTSPTRGTTSGTAPNLTYTPRFGESGTDTLAFVANDGYHDSVPATITFAISATNPWPEADLGQAPAAGSVQFTPTGTIFVVRGSGDLGAGGDGGRYTWTTLPGDGALVARVASVTGGRGGAMLRSSTAVDAACAALILDGGQLLLAVRAGDGAAVATTALGAQTAPCWLRLQRTSGGIEAASSGDGRAWSVRGTATLMLPESALAGLWAGSPGPAPAQLTADQVRTHHSLDRTWQTFGASPARTGVVPGSFTSAPFAQLWQAAPGGDLQPVAVGNGLVFATKYLYMATGWIKAIDLATGSERWHVSTPSAYSVNPASFADGRVFVQRCNNAGDTHLWSLSAATGTILWKAPFAAQWGRYLSGCTADGLVAVNGGTYGGMYGFDQVDGTQRFFNSGFDQIDQWAPASAGGQLCTWVGGKVRQHDPLTGITAWTLDLLNGDGRGTVPVIAGTSLVLRGAGALHAVDLGTRAKRWTVNAAVAGTPAVTADTVYALVGTQLNAYALGSGSLLRSFTASGALVGQPVVADDVVVVASASTTWVLDRGTLAVRQSLDIGGHLALAGRTLVIANANGIIRAYSAPVISGDLAADPQSVASDEDAAAAIVLTGSGPAGRPLAFEIVTAPQHGSLDGSPPAVTYRPHADYTGNDSFSFVVRDGIYASLPATVTIAIAPINDPPTLAPRRLRIDDAAAVSFTATVADPDSAVVTLALAEAPRHGTVAIDGWVVTYTPAPEPLRNDSFMLTASDGLAVSEPQLVTVGVVPPGDKLVAPDAAADHQFGTAVAIAGDWAAVGAPRAGRGRVYLYQRVASEWIHRSTILADAENANDWFGVSVALAGDTLAVGSCNGSRAGVTVYTRSAADAWTRQGMYISAYDAATVLAENEILGYAGGAWVALDGDLLALGAPLDGYGAVTIYRRDGTGQWAWDAKFSGTSSTMRFGWGVALSGSRLAVGAHRADGSVTACGAVLAYERQSAGWGAQQLIRPAGLAAYDWFGYAVAMDGDRLVVGAPQHDQGGGDAGALWVYTANAGAWTLQTKLANDDADPAWDQLGKSVAIGGERIVAGAPYAWTDGIGATGRITSWIAAGAGWSVEDRRTTFDAADQDWVGERLDIDGDRVIAGVPLDDDAGLSSGSAYVLNYLPRSLPPTAQDGTATTREDQPVEVPLAGSDPDGGAVTVEVLSGPAHGSLVGDGAIRMYLPAPDWSGVDSVVFRVGDGGLWSGEATLTITVQAVNDRPAFLVGADQTADGDARPVTVSGWIAQFMPGPADESGQSASYTVTADRSDLFDVQPAVSAAGTLTFTPALGAVGTAIITVDCRDDGGTALGGIDAAPSATAIIAILSPWDAELAAEAVTAVSLVASDTQAGEAGDTASVRLVRSGPLGGDLVVNLTCSGTAGNGIDVDRLPASIAIPAGQAMCDIAISPVPDGLAEGNESLTVAIAPGAGYLQLPGTLQSATVTLVDDEPVTVNVAAGDATMTEPLDSGSFTISRTGAPITALTVQLSVAGTAVAGSDYVALPTVVTIPAGAATISVPARVLDDAEAEERETVILTVQPGAGYGVGTAQATATIGDNEPEEIGVTAVGVAAEPGISGSFRIYRRGVSTAARTLTYTIAGSATAGSDYPALPGSVTLAANASSASIPVTPGNDSLVEPPESVEITLDAAGGASLVGTTATLAILDNDGTTRPVVSLKAGAAAAREPATDGSFVITRTGTTAAPLRVRLLPASGSATAGVDYATMPGEVEVPAGAASVILTVHPQDDQLAELSETVGLALAPSVDYNVSSTRSGTVTIADNEEPAVSLTVADGTAAEPGADTGRWTVARSGDLGQALTVLLARSGSAGSGSDHAAVPAAIIIPAGAASATVTLTAMDDGEAETDEQAMLRILPDPAYRLGGAVAGTVTIRDDEAPVIDLIAFDPTATEGGDTGRFRIQRRGSVAGALTIPLAWTGTAQNGSDANALPASAALASGAAVLDLTVTVRQDSSIEPVEMLVGTLLPGAGYTIGQSEATVRIADDEAGGAVAIRLASSGGYEFDAARTVVEVFRTGRIGTAITVPYALAGTAMVHDQNVPQQVLIPSGADRVRLLLTPLRDERVESDETVILRLLPGSGYSLGGGAESVFTIIEAPPGPG